jgi:hypothetical protein
MEIQTCQLAEILILNRYGTKEFVLFKGETTCNSTCRNKLISNKIGVGEKKIIKEYLQAVLRIRICTDPQCFWSAGSGSALGMLIRIQDKNDPQK